MFREQKDTARISPDGSCTHQKETPLKSFVRLGKKVTLPSENSSRTRGKHFPLSGMDVLSVPRIVRTRHVAALNTDSGSPLLRHRL